MNFFCWINFCRLLNIFMFPIYDFKPQSQKWYHNIVKNIVNKKESRCPSSKEKNNSICASFSTPQIENHVFRSKYQGRHTASIGEKNQRIQLLRTKWRAISPLPPSPDLDFPTANRQTNKHVVKEDKWIFPSEIMYGNWWGSFASSTTRFQRENSGFAYNILRATNQG